MANVVEYILKITGGKSKKNIRDLAKELDLTKKELEWFNKNSKTGFDGLTNSSKRAGKSLSSLRTDFTLLAGAVTAAAASYFQFTKQVADSVNELVDASTRSGIATQKLAGLKLALEGSGRSFSEVERGLDRFKLKMVEVAKGTGNVSKIMGPSGLGISIKNLDGSMRDVDDVFTEVIEKLSKMEDATSKNIAVQELFGRAGGALIQSGAIEDLDKFIQQAKELGPALDENGIQKAAQFQRGLAELKTAFVGFVQVILEGVSGEKGIGPSMSKLASELKGFAQGILTFIKVIDKFAKDVNSALQPLIKSAGGLPKLLSNLPGFSGISVFNISKKAFQKVKPSPQNEAIKETKKEVIDLEKEFASLQTRQEKINLLAKADLTFENRRQVRKLRKEFGITFQEIQEAQKKLEASENIVFDPKLFDSKPPKTMKKEVKELTSSLLSYQNIIDPKKLDLVKKSLTFDIPGIGKIQLPSIEQVVKDYEKEQKKFSDINKAITDSTQEAFEEIAKIQEKHNKKIANSNKAFLDLKNRIESIGEIERPFQDVIDDLDETKNRFKELGQSTLPVLDLKMQVIDLRKEVEKLAKMETSVEIAGEVIGLAGGGILESLMSIIGKFLKGDAAKMFKIFSAIIPQVATFGADMMKAGEDAVQKVEERREQKEIKRLEEAFGRSLTDAEKQRVQNEIKIGEKEREKISAQAMKEKVEFDVRQVAMAIEVGLRVLPEILLNVLPPLLLELAFRIIKGIGEAIKNIFHTLFVKNPKDILDGLKSFFGLDSKRSGGRMISARRGLRFTGSSDTMAQLHRNEYVVPESGARPQAVERIMNQQSGSGINITINADVVERDAIEELVRKIERRFQNFGTMQSTLFGA
jgi:hypothetical protein